MTRKDVYANGQKIHELDGDTLTYYFKNGKIRAQGAYINELMEGEWRFYRETGQLWQIGHFKNNMKNGLWIRYDKNNVPEYSETFSENKVIKKS